MSRIWFDTHVHKSPFFAATERHGCKRYAVSRDIYYPRLFDTELREYERLVQDVTLWDVPSERPIEISGHDALRFADRLVTRNLSDHRPGRCKYILFTDDQGDLIDEAVLLHVAPDRLLISAEFRQSDFMWMRGVALDAGLEVQISLPEIYPLQIQGPKARDVVRALAGDAAATLPYFGLLETSIAGIPAIVTRTGWSGELGFEVFLCEAARGDELFEHIVTTGRPFGLAVTGSSEIRRIEAGILSYDEFCATRDPFELGLSWAVELDKPAAFIGQAALRARAQRAPMRRMAGIVIRDTRAASLPLEQFPWRVAHASQDVGFVTTMAFSPRLDALIGYALLETSCAQVDRRLEIEAPGGALEARVAKLPFVPWRARD